MPFRFPAPNGNAPAAGPLNGARRRSFLFSLSALYWSAARLDSIFSSSSSDFASFSRISFTTFSGALETKFSFASFLVCSAISFSHFAFSRVRRSRYLSLSIRSSIGRKMRALPVAICTAPYTACSRATDTPDAEASRSKNGAQSRKTCSKSVAI